MTCKREGVVFRAVVIPGLSSGPTEASAQHGQSRRTQPLVSSMPLASVTAALKRAGLHMFSSPDEPISDESTGTQHPGELCDLKNGRCAQLLGVGPRRKRVVGIKDVDVYSVGMYANVDQLQKRTEKYNGATATAMASDADLLADLKDPDIEKEIRMVTTFRAVSQKTFWEALDTRLAPILREAESMEDLPKLKSHFDNVQFTKGTEIKFAMSSNGCVSTFINGERRGNIESPALGAALTDIYIGQDPPSPLAKADFFRSVAALVTREEAPTL